MAIFFFFFLERDVEFYHNCLSGKQRVWVI